MTRRSLLRSLLALPLAPVAVKFGLKPPWSSRPTIPGRGVLDYAAMQRITRNVMLPGIRRYMENNNVLLQRFERSSGKSAAIVAPINGATMDTMLVTG